MSAFLSICVFTYRFHMLLNSCVRLVRNKLNIRLAAEGPLFPSSPLANQNTYFTSPQAYLQPHANQGRDINLPGRSSKARRSLCSTQLDEIYLQQRNRRCPTSQGFSVDPVYSRTQVSFWTSRVTTPFLFLSKCLSSIRLVVTVCGPKVISLQVTLSSFEKPRHILPTCVLALHSQYITAQHTYLLVAVVPTRLTCKQTTQDQFVFIQLGSFFIRNTSHLISLLS